MSLRKLASETAIYGLASIVGRGLYFLLTPLYTGIFEDVELGIQSDVFVIISFLVVFAGLRLDVAYFRFHGKLDEGKLLGTTAIVTAAVAGTIGVSLALAAEVLASAFGYPAYSWLFALAGGILTFDALVELPLARLRMQGRAVKFAAVRIGGILLNLGLNVAWLYALPRWSAAPDWMSLGVSGIGYIFLANLISSAFVWLLLVPELRGMNWRIDQATLKRLLTFSLPLVLVGVSFIVNEMLDRKLLPLVWPGGVEEGLGLLGVYSQNYKLAMLLALFTQAFRYGVEPFVFRESGNADAKQKYAKLAHYYLIAALIGVLAVTLFLPVFSQIFLQAEVFREGSDVVPILLLANLMLGLYYNFSVWYKVTDKTRIGAYIGLGGAAITVALNLLLIPRYGFYGCAWTTLACYTSMAMAAVLLGQRRYAIPYRFGTMAMYGAAALALMALSWGLSPKLVKPVVEMCVEGGSWGEWAASVGLGTGLLSIFLTFVWYQEYFGPRREASGMANG